MSETGSSSSLIDSSSSSNEGTITESDTDTDDSDVMSTATDKIRKCQDCRIHDYSQRKQQRKCTQPVGQKDCGMTTGPQLHILDDNHEMFRVTNYLFTEFCEVNIQTNKN